MRGQLRDITRSIEKHKHLQVLVQLDKEGLLDETLAKDLCENIEAAFTRNSADQFDRWMSLAEHVSAVERLKVAPTQAGRLANIWTQRAVEHFA